MRLTERRGLFDHLSNNQQCTEHEHQLLNLLLRFGSLVFGQHTSEVTQFGFLSRPIDVLGVDLMIPASPALHADILPTFHIWTRQSAEALKLTHKLYNRVSGGIFIVIVTEFCCIHVSSTTSFQRKFFRP